MSDTYPTLLQAWQPKHLEHLLSCLTQNKDYYGEDFSFDGVDEHNQPIINTLMIHPEEIIYTLATYYDDNTMHYQTPFRDFVYFAFTDLVEDEVNILLELDKDTA